MLARRRCYERHHAELGEEWLAVDEYQLDALRGSILQIDAHASHYLRLADAKEKPDTVNKGSARGRFTRTRRDRWGLRLRQDNSSRQPLYRLYGAKSLKAYEEPEPRDWRQDLDNPERGLLVTSERVGKFLNSGAGKATQAVLILLLAALLCISGRLQLKAYRDETRRCASFVFVVGKQRCEKPCPNGL